MKEIFHKLRLLLILPVLGLLLSFPALAQPADDPVPYVRIGLYWGDSALEGANLLNYVGSGYDFGYFDAQRQFVPLLHTEEKAISMLKDWTLVYEGGQYVSGGSGSVRVGCYHIRLGECETYEEAALLAGEQEDGYVAVMNGKWAAFCGSYTSLSAAQNAIGERGIYGTAMTASSRCVTVVATGTDRVLFQYDCGTESTLGVMPSPSEDGEKPITWFRGFKYYGGFQYTRRDGGDLTVVNFVPMDDYVCGVVPYEMSPSWPLEALKAQAVSARTYAAAHLDNHTSLGFDLCNGPCCQAYLGVDVDAPVCLQAVAETVGIYMTYEGNMADTYYHSCDGGATENSENVFYEAIPYLRGVKDPYESHVETGFEHWSYVYTTDEITWILRQKGYNCARIESITPVYTEMGNIFSLTFNDVNGVKWTFSRSRASTILNSQTYGRTIRSQRFTVTDADAPQADSLYVNDASTPVEESGRLWAVDGSGLVQSVSAEGGVQVITASGTASLSLNGAGGSTVSSGRYLVSGSGWGHNVGMSQYGAKAMAELGFTYEEILKFYYSGVDVG